MRGSWRYRKHQSVSAERCFRKAFQHRSPSVGQPSLFSLLEIPRVHTIPPKIHSSNIANVGRGPGRTARSVPSWHLMHACFLVQIQPRRVYMNGGRRGEIPCTVLGCRYALLLRSRCGKGASEGRLGMASMISSHPDNSKSPTQ